MAIVEMELDVADGVRVCGYEHIDGGHAFEVEWELPDECVCEKCHRRQRVRLEWGRRMQVVRDLDVWGQPGFLVYQPPFHRCGWCRHRQWLLPPFKRKHVTVTYRFEEQVLRMMIGSTEEEVARRLGISAEMVRLILKHRLQEERQIDPQRVITDVGLDEISLKKRHKLYATILSDLTDPKQPRILAVAPGRDQAAAETCLKRLSEPQRAQVRNHRTDMSPAYTAAGEALLPHSQQVVDRFHVAKKLGEVVDRVRKKDACLQKEAVCEREETVPLADVGFPQTAAGPDGRGARAPGEAVRADSRPVPAVLFPLGSHGHL
jgi:transposase